MKQNITKTIQLIVFVLCYITNVNAQILSFDPNVICLGCPTTEPSAVMDIRALDRGILVPRIANTSVISNPAAGLMIYDNSVNGFQYYDGIAWKRIGGVDYIALSINNSFIGVDAGTSTTAGAFNTATGAYAMLSNTSGNQNTANGYNTLRFNTTGDGNTAVGNLTMTLNTTGDDNTAVGQVALNGNTIGYENTAIGSYSLSNNTTGYRNTAIGHDAFASGNYINSTAIGYQAQPTGSNQVRLGNANITQIGGYANWSNVSDARFKTQVQNNVPGLAFISRLNPVTYQMDMDAIAKHQHTPDSLRLFDSEREKAAIRYTGFLAQEVEQVAELVGYDFSGVDKPQHEQDNYSLRYAEFVVPLVKAVQELEIENEQLRAEKDAEIADLKARLSKIEALLEK